MIKVLIADDHAVLRDGIRALLSLYSDINIIGEAYEGKDTLAKALELSPDVVLMDIAMPGMDGLEATRRIVKHRPEIKVLVLSQHDKCEYILQAVKAGAKGYVSKRALASELISAIRTVSSGDSFLYPSAAATLINHYRNQRRNEPFEGLTTREKEILRMITAGLTSRDIANTLGISLKTVSGHRAKIMKALDIHNHMALIKYAVNNRLTQID